MLVKSLKKRKPSELIMIMLGFSAIIFLSVFMANIGYGLAGLKSVGFLFPAFIGVFFTYYLIRAVIIFKQQVLG